MGDTRGKGPSFFLAKASPFCNYLFLRKITSEVVLCEVTFVRESDRFVKIVDTEMAQPLGGIEGRPIIMRYPWPRKKRMKSWASLCHDRSTGTPIMPQRLGQGLHVIG